MPLKRNIGREGRREGGNMFLVVSNLALFRSFYNSRIVPPVPLMTL